MASGVGFAAARFGVLSSQAKNPLILIYRGKDRAKLVCTASVSGIYFRSQTLPGSADFVAKVG
jgi:hypothetical protein